MPSEKKKTGKPWLRWVVMVLLSCLSASLLILAWLVRRGDFYEPGSDFGYNLGLVGGLMMTTLLIYSLRKRFFPHDRLGGMGSWFKYHMLVGIASPILILFHATFKTTSVNGAFALYSMLLVGLSGVVGRFIYRHIHQGLYGRQLTLADVTAELKANAERVDSVFYQQPAIEERLHKFQNQAFASVGLTPLGFWRFMVLGWRARRLAVAVGAQAKDHLAQEFQSRRGHPGELLLSQQLAQAQIDDYLESVVKASQFSVWEKLFSAWHLIHIPFLYLLIFCGIVHVVAVHMY